MTDYPIPDEIIQCKWSRIEPFSGKEMVPQAHCDHPESLKELENGGFADVLCLGPHIIPCPWFERFIKGNK